MKNRSKHTKSLDCKICGDEVPNVGEDAEKITCWRCVNKSMSTVVLPSEEEDILDDDE